MKSPRPAWAVGAQLEAVKQLKTMHLMVMTEKEYEQKIKRLTKEYNEAQRIAEDHYP